MKTILASYLTSDERLKNPPVAKKRIYTSAHYEIYISIYAGMADKPPFPNDLVAGLVIYKEENLQLLVRLATYEHLKDPNRHIQRIVAQFDHSGKKPLELIRQAKSWCNIPLTPHDCIALAEVGININNAA